MNTQASEIITLLKGVSQDCQALLRQEAALLRTELKQDLKEAGAVGAEAGMSAALLHTGGLLLLLGLVLALNWFFPQLPFWGSMLLVGAILSATGLALGLKARSEATRLDLLPRQTLQSVKKDLRLLSS